MVLSYVPVQPEWHKNAQHLIKKPSVYLQHSIAYVYQLNFDNTHESTVLLHGIPDGCIDVVFNLNGDVNDCYLIPSTRERVMFPFNKAHEYFGIRLLPLQTIFPITLPLATLNEIQKVPLFLASPSLRELYDLLLRATNLHERLHAVEQFICDKQQAIYTPSDLMKNCLHIIYKERGRAKLIDLEQYTCYTTRYLRKVFQAELGISPKAFLDIVYVQFAVQELLCSHFSLEQHLFDYELYDVSHFYKKFKKTVQMTPIAYVRLLQSTAESLRFT